MDNASILEAFEKYNEAIAHLVKIVKEITIEEEHNYSYGKRKTIITIPIVFKHRQGAYTKHHVLSKGKPYLYERGDGYKNFKYISLSDFLNLPDYSGEPRIEVIELS